MRKIYCFLILSCLVLWLNGCSSLHHIIQPVSEVEPTVGVQALPSYSGPKARIAIADFEVKALKASEDIGAGLKEMLGTALVNSSRFSIGERPNSKAGIKDSELSVSGTTNQVNKTDKNKINSADLLVSATLVEFEPQASGGRAGVGGGGGAGNGVLGSLLGGSLNKAFLALDIRLIDISTSEILASTTVQGQASDISGAIMAEFLEGWALGSRLAVYANTPMEKAIRICIIESVKYIAQATAPGYYKY